MKLHSPSVLIIRRLAWLEWLCPLTCCAAWHTVCSKNVSYESQLTYGITSEQRVSTVAPCTKIQYFLAVLSVMSIHTQLIASALKVTINQFGHSALMHPTGMSFFHIVKDDISCNLYFTDVDLNSAAGVCWCLSPAYSVKAVHPGQVTDTIHTHTYTHTHLQ